MLKGNPNQLCLCVSLRDREQLLSFMMKDHNTFRVFKFDRMDFFGCFSQLQKCQSQSCCLESISGKRDVYKYTLSAFIKGNVDLCSGNL